MQTISDICTTITTKFSSWSTLSKHNRDWILTQMKRASEAILSDYWVFKIPKDYIYNLVSKAELIHSQDSGANHPSLSFLTLKINKESSSSIHGFNLL